MHPMGHGGVKKTLARICFVRNINISSIWAGFEGEERVEGHQCQNCITQWTAIEWKDNLWSARVEVI